MVPQTREGTPGKVAAWIFQGARQKFLRDFGFDLSRSLHVILDSSISPNFFAIIFRFDLFAPSSVFLREISGGGRPWQKNSKRVKSLPT